MRGKCATSPTTHAISNQRAHSELTPWGRAIVGTASRLAKLWKSRVYQPHLCWTRQWGKAERARGTCHPNHVACHGVPKPLTQHALHLCCCSYMLERVDMVLVGAEGVVENGGVINKVGMAAWVVLGSAPSGASRVTSEAYNNTRTHSLCYIRLAHISSPWWLLPRARLCMWLPSATSLLASSPSTNAMCPRRLAPSSRCSRPCQSRTTPRSWQWRTRCVTTRRPSTLRCCSQTSASSHPLPSLTSSSSCTHSKSKHPSKNTCKLQTRPP